MNEINELYDKIVAYGIATEQELNLITSINGYNLDTLNEVIYVRTGYLNIGQFDESVDYYE